jgi:hypothetical protein
VIGNRDAGTQGPSGVPQGYLRSSGETATEPRERLLPVDAASIDAIMSGRFRLEHAPCAYRKSSPDIFVMQSAEDRAAKNTPCPHYGAR